MQKSLFVLNNKGSAIIFALIFSVSFGIAVAGVLTLTSKSNEIYTQDIELLKNHWAKESALNVVMRAVAQQQDVWTNFLAGDTFVSDSLINGCTTSVVIEAATGTSPNDFYLDISAATALRSGSVTRRDSTVILNAWFDESVEPFEDDPEDVPGWDNMHKLQTAGVSWKDTIY